MAITAVFAGGRHKAVPRRGLLFRLAFGIAKPFLAMSAASALKSANAQEFVLPQPAGENNWRSRQTFCSALSEALEKNPGDVPAGFASIIEPFWANILDCAVCERTTLSIQACRLLGTLPRVMHRDFVHQYDRVLPVLVRQTASTKSVAQKSASAAIQNIISSAGFTPRLLYHVCTALEDKYSGPKLYAPIWLKQIIDDFYPALSPERDFEMISRAISAGLEEADNNVRVNSRATFWAYHKINKAGAEDIMAKLNNHAKTALLNDPNNPDKNAKPKSKKSADAAPALAEIRQQAKERMKQKTSERNRVVSTKTISSDDFPFGPLNLGDDKHAQKQLHTTKSLDETMKAPSKPIAIHKKDNSSDSKLASSANTEPSTSARPLLSAPVRRPRIVATPIIQPQSTKRAPAPAPAPVPAPVPALAPARMISEGKENANYYSTSNMMKRVDRTSPERLVVTSNRDLGPQGPPKMIVFGPDSLTKEQRLQRQQLDKEINDMAPQMPLMAAFMEQQDEEKNTQMYYAYSDMNHNGQVDQARDALEKALAYLNKDALDYMGFRKLRKLLETFGSHLITDQALYDLLWSELLPRLGTFEELLPKQVKETAEQGHPRYIRQAVLTMVSILIRDYPPDWSYQYQGPALASCMIARCAYSANCDPHEGAPYVHSMTIVNQINACIYTITENCRDPAETLDSVLSMLDASEAFLMKNAPFDSEAQNTFGSFNPYSKENRVRVQHQISPWDNVPKHLTASEAIDPKPLPKKLPLLMETGLRIIKLLISRACLEDFKLGTAREDALAGLAQHLMMSYNIIIRHHVMEYCQVLYTIFESPDRFWSLFPGETERNLLHYYLERSRAS